MSTATPPLRHPGPAPRRGRHGLAVRQRYRTRRPSWPAIGWIGLALVGVVGVLALAAPVVSPYPPERMVGASFESPSARHLLGTNQIGQDLASQLLAGARVSITVALIAGLLTVVLGAAVGITAGWRGGLVDVALMRAVDVALAIPRLPLLIVVGLYAGDGLVVIAVVIASVFWPGTARMLRAQVRALRGSARIQAARSFGAGSWHLMRRHVIPELGLILVAALVGAAGRAVLFEAGLAFLGIGDTARMSWGSTINAARRTPGLFYTDIWVWWLLPPVIALGVFLLGVTFLGIAVEQHVNPRLARHAGR